MSLRTTLQNALGRSVAALLLAAGLFAPFGTVSAASSQPRDNDANAIIWGGCYTKSECLKKINQGDGHNTAASIQKVMYQEGRGISEANFAKAVDGVVHKNGNVTVGGKVVATGARSVGRHKTEGSVQSGSVWERSVSKSFVADSIPAYVYMENGVFTYAVIKSCGNPVRAMPKTSPTPNPTPPPKPMSFECVVLTPTQPDKAGRPTLFRFTLTPKTSNVTISGYRFSFSDGSAVTDTPATQAYIEREVKSGSLTVHGQVKTSAGISAKTEACSATVTVKTTSPTPTPTTPPAGKGGAVLGATLPEAGAEMALGGMAGVAALGYASRAYLRSRQDLLNALRNKR